MASACRGATRGQSGLCIGALTVQERARQMNVDSHQGDAVAVEREMKGLLVEIDRMLGYVHNQIDG